MKMDKSMVPECASAKPLQRRPHPSSPLLRVNLRKGTHPGNARRIKRWHKYQEGMSILHCRETEGLDHLDVLYYEKHGLMTLRDMTPKERQEALRRWDSNNPDRDDAVHEPIAGDERTPSVIHGVHATAHIPERYRARVETTKPEAEIRTLKGNTDWDVNPWTGRKDPKTYEEWRAYYDKRRKKNPPYDARKEWEKLKLGFNLLIVAPMKILAALGLLSKR